MKVENFRLYNWHEEIASYYCPNANIVFTMGIEERKINNYTKDYLVGFWKIKKLKQ